MTSRENYLRNAAVYQWRWILRSILVVWLRSVAALVFLSLSSTAGNATTLEGRVVAVSDGDTITVITSSGAQQKIRLAGIDAPEKGQPFSNRSKQNLSDLVFGKHVVVDYNKVDRYGRLVGKVQVSGRDANLHQLKAGLAWVFQQYEHELSPQDRKSYNEAESSARAAKRGLWFDPRPQPPWEFRHPDRASAPASEQKAEGAGLVIGNKRSGIYHLPSCPDYSKVSPRNREYFPTADAAERAGYRKARNCP